MQLDVKDKPRARVALDMATYHHRGITRRYTNEPYINHPIRVAETLLGARFISDEILAAALLHDCLEDENVDGVCMSPRFIATACGERVLRWVELLSNTEKGPRDVRKRKAAERIAAAPVEVRAIKLADIIDNCAGLAQLDPRFAETYLNEKRAMVGAMTTTGIPSYTALRLKAMDVIGVETNELAMLHLGKGLALEEERKADDALIASILAEEERSVFAEVALF